MVNNYCVYIHTTPNNKKYVGITCKKPQYRWNDGKGYKRNKHFFLAICKYGWENITHEIIKSNIVQEEACELEKQLIKEYKTNEREFGYNKSTGGDKSGAGVKYTPEQIQKMRKNRIYKTGWKHTEEARKMISLNNAKNLLGKKGKDHPAFNKIVSEETRKKISISKSGSNNPHFNKPSEFAKKVNQYDLENNFIKTFNSLKEAAIYLGKTHSHISQCCNGKRNKAYGFIWKFN